MVHFFISTWYTFGSAFTYANTIEKRLDDSYFTLDNALTSNQFYLQKCIEFGLDYTLVDEEYNIDFGFPE